MKKNLVQLAFNLFLPWHFQNSKLRFQASDPSLLAAANFNTAMQYKMALSVLNIKQRHISTIIIRKPSQMTNGWRSARSAGDIICIRTIRPKCLLFFLSAKFTSVQWSILSQKCGINSRNDIMSSLFEIAAFLI